MMEPETLLISKNVDIEKEQWRKKLMSKAKGIGNVHTVMFWDYGDSKNYSLAVYRNDDTSYIGVDPYYFKVNKETFKVTARDTERKLCNARILSNLCLLMVEGVMSVSGSDDFDLIKLDVDSTNRKSRYVGRLIIGTNPREMYMNEKTTVGCRKVAWVL